MNDNFTDIDDLPPSLLIEDDIAESLKNFATTGTSLHRRMYGRVLALMLQKPLEEILDNINPIISTMLLIAEDDDPTIRISLADKIPHIFKRCHELNNSDIEYYFYNTLIQIVLKYLKDDDNASVVAYSSLSCLLNRKYIDVKRIEEMVCPVIIEMTKKIDVQEIDNQLNAIGLIARVAPLIGRDKTEKLLLNRFIEMCSDDAYYIRRGCAISYATICQVMGEEVTENQLINSFIKLCQDDVWGIRKACAECLPMIALLCSRECRRNILAPMVFELLNDSSLWVSNTAFMKLGNFLSSFAIPCITGLAFSENGELYITNAIDDEEFRNNCNKDMLKNLEYYDQLFAESTLPLDSDFIRIEDSTNVNTNSTNAINSPTITEDMVTSSTQSASSPTFANLLKNDNYAMKIEDIPINNFLNMYSNDYTTRKYDSYGIASQSLSSSSSSPITTQTTSDSSTDASIDITPSLDKSNNNEVIIDNTGLSTAAAVEEDVSSTTTPKLKMPAIFDLSPLTMEKKHIIGNRRFNDRYGKNFHNNNQKRQQAMDQQFMYKKNAPEDLPSIVKLAIENREMEQQKIRKLLKQPYLLGTAGVSAATSSTSSDEKSTNWNHNNNIVEPETPDIESAPTNALTFPIVTNNTNTTCSIYTDNNLDKATENLNNNNDGDDDKNVCNLDNVFYDDLKKSSSNDDGGAIVVTGKINFNVVTAGANGKSITNEIKHVDEDRDNNKQEQKYQQEEEDEDCNFNSHQFWYIHPAPIELEDINLILEEKRGPPPVVKINCKTAKLTTTILPSLTLNENKENLHFNMNNNNHNIKRRTILSKYDANFDYKKSSSNDDDDDDDDDKLENNNLINNYNKSITTIASLTTARKISEICKNSKYKQDIIPIDLLDYYVKMSTMAEKDINVYCATNFPAIVLTLGRSNWPLLYNLLQSLANDIHSAIRKILASCIYLIALIIGREYATKDLVPIYINFFSDSDEVKIVAIRNLSNFLKVIKPSRHFEIIDTLPECFDPDNKGYSSSWRFREEYALQILKLIEIHDVYIRNDESLTFLEVAVITLLSDKISCIRQIGLDAMIARIKCCKSDYCSIYKLLIENFRYSNDWRKRQTFILFCCKLIEENITDEKLINQELIKHINGLVFDPIANIRLFVAKFLAKEIIGKGFFKDDLSFRTIIIEWIYILQIDKDRDVREMAVCDEIPSVYENTESYQKILNDYSNYNNIIIMKKEFNDNDCNDNMNNNNIVEFGTEIYGDNTNNDEKNAQDKITEIFHMSNNTTVATAEATATGLEMATEEAQSNDNEPIFDSVFEQLISNIRLDGPTDNDANDIQMLMTKDDDHLTNSVSSSSSSSSCSSSSSGNSNISFSGGDQQQQQSGNYTEINNETQAKGQVVMPILEGGDVAAIRQKFDNVTEVAAAIDIVVTKDKTKTAQQNNTSGIVEEAEPACLENNNFKSIIVKTDNFVEK